MVHNTIQYAVVVIMIAKVYRASVDLDDLRDDPGYGPNNVQVISNINFQQKSLSIFGAILDGIV